MDRFELFSLRLSLGRKTGGLPAAVCSFPVNSGKETGSGGTEMCTALPAGGWRLIEVDGQRNAPLRSAPAHRNVSVASHTERARGWDSHTAGARMPHLPSSRRTCPVLQAGLLGKHLLCAASAHLLELDLKNSESMYIMYQRGYV